MIARTGAFVALALGFAACTSGSDHDARHGRLENVLLETGVTICDGGCTGYSANSARCTGDGVTIARRVFFECRIDWEGDAVPDDHFCAALGGRGGYTARELRDCT